MKHAIFLAALISVFGVVGCDDMTPQSVRDDAAKQERISLESNAQVGMPGITNFTEKKLVRRLYELRDQGIATHSYIQDMQGRLWHLCDSIGYGLPYGVQFTNPERPVEGKTQGEFIGLPQPEPNGLYMPPGAEGTWVMCAAPKGDPTAVYVEPRVIVSPFALNSVGEYSAK